MVLLGEINNSTYQQQSVTEILVYFYNISIGVIDFT